jgi:hypothetical protein
MTLKIGDVIDVVHRTEHKNKDDQLLVIKTILDEFDFTLDDPYDMIVKHHAVVIDRLAEKMTMSSKNIETVLVDILCQAQVKCHYSDIIDIESCNDDVSCSEMNSITTQSSVSYANATQNVLFQASLTTANLILTGINTLLLLVILSNRSKK